jgi:protein TonB
MQLSSARGGRSGRGHGVASALEKLLGLAFKLSGAVVVSYLLFIMMPLLHALFGGDLKPQLGQLNQRRVIARIEKKKEKKEKRRQRRIRKISSAKARRSTGGHKMKFVPNLGALGGGGVAVEAHQARAVIFNEGDTDESPVPLRVTPIPYPDLARAQGISGKLLLEIIIGRNGHVESVRILRSPHSSFASAARRAAMTWRFKPGKNKGVPVRVRARKTIEFKLNQ